MASRTASGFFCTLCLWSLMSFICAQSYQDVYKLQEDLFTNYSTTIRPLCNQSNKVTISPSFTLIAIVDVDELQQMIVVNGFLGLLWQDELLTWNRSVYNGISFITPDPVAIWKPRMVLVNTMDERDLFEDDYAPVSVSYDGTTTWFPGGLFPSLCLLDLRKFPFDKHHCEFLLVPMMMNASQVEFNMTYARVDQALFIENGEWTLQKAEIVSIPLDNDGFISNTIRLELTIKRKPAFFIINIFFPVLFLCTLNVLTFMIPVDAGEKIGFSITVLLSMAVYMSIVGDTLPSNSEYMPYMTIYIFYLFSLSVVCCTDTLVIVWLHHKEEEEDKRQQRQLKRKSVFSRLKIMNMLRRPSNSTTKIFPTPSDSSETLTEVECTENDEDEPAGAPPSEAPTSDPSTSQWDSPAVLKPPSLLQKIKAGLTPKNSSHDMNAPKRDHLPVRIRKNRYKNLAEKLNFISAIIFGILSVVTTCIMLILIAA